ncbi:MAG: hypothetical protein KJO69_04170 [Gammaproteobacteria bacterium]|nr:hypothetical protein [Gammaproteobacteria bacterium]
MASCAEEIHVGDIGTVFRIALTDCDVAVDLTGATTLEIIFLKPDATSVTKTATLFGVATDGVIQYSTIADDLDTAGIWKMQAKITLPTGTWSSDVEKFRVYTNLV